MEGTAPKVTYSINPAAWQFWAWMIGTAATIVIFGWGSISFVAGRAFDERLRQFHEIAKPEIGELVRREVAIHAALPAHTGVIERITAREIRDSAADEQIAAIRLSLQELNRKVDIIIANGNHIKAAIAEDENDG